jgi:hypothetical protein
MTQDAVNNRDEYTRRRSDSLLEAELERIRQWQSRMVQPQPAAGEQSPQPTIQATTTDPLMGTEFAGAVTEGQSPVPFDRDTLARSRPANQFISETAAVLRNLGDFAAQLPAGVWNGVGEVGIAVDDIANWATGSEGRGLLGRAGEAFQGANPIGAPSTPGGEFGEEVGRFLFGLVGGNRIIKMAASGTRLAGAGRGATALRYTIAGAGADAVTADPDEENLAALWNKAGLPENALTEFLATDPTDMAAYNRFRNAAIGGAVGGVLDTTMEALVRAARLLRGLKGTEREINTATAATRPTLRPDAERDAVLQGDPNKPLVERRLREADAAAANADEAVGSPTAPNPSTPEGMVARTELPPAADPGEFNINWGRIGSPEDVQSVMRDMAGIFRGGIDEATRGTISADSLSKLANTLGMTPETLMARQVGSAFNAEEILAARTIYEASGQQLLSLARIAAGPSGGPAEQLAFQKMLRIHQVIQAQVMGARSEAGRALAAWRNIVTDTGKAAEQINRYLDDMPAGLIAESRDNAQSILKAAEVTGDLNAVVRSQGRSGFRRWDAAGAEAFQNALLSAVKTFVVNFLGNSIATGLAPIERATAQAISRSRFGSGAMASDGMINNEAAQLTIGMLGSSLNAFKVVGYALAGKNPEDVSRWLVTRMDNREPAITAANLVPGTDPNSMIAKGIDFIGSVIRLPYKGMYAADMFSREILKGGELSALAVRHGRQNLLDRGQEITPQALRDEALVLRNHPTEQMLREAEEFYVYNTFQRNPGGIGQALIWGKNNLSILGWTNIPFPRTMVNLAGYSLERSPFAPLVGQWRDDFAAGGARQDMAMARMGLGTMGMAVFFHFADLGWITGGGPDDLAERQPRAASRIPPYSIKVGDNWYSYNVLDPLAFGIAFAATAADIVAQTDIEPEELDSWREVGNAVSLLIGRTLVDRTALKSISSLIEFVSVGNTSSANPQIDGPTSIAGQALSGFIPSLLAESARIQDPQAREMLEFSDWFKARLPFLKQGLNPARTIWGDPVVRGLSGAEPYNFAAVRNAMSPVTETDPIENPIDRELMRQGIGIDPIGRTVNFGDGADINMREYPKALDEYRVLAGNELKHPIWNLGLKDTLNALVTGQTENPILQQMHQIYLRESDGQDGGKQMMIRELVTEFRREARQEILARHPELRRDVQERLEAQEIQKAPPELKDQVRSALELRRQLNNSMPRGAWGGFNQ